jgi:TP901 family phage tail tape measure protein
MAGKIHDEQLNVDININGNKAQKQLGVLQQQERNLLKTQKDLRAEKAKLIAQGKKESEAYKNVTDEMKKNNLVLGKNKEAQTRLRKEIGITSLTTTQLAREQKRLKAIMGKFSPNTPQWKNYNNQLKKVDGQLQKVRFEMKGTNNVIGKMKRNFSSFTGVLAGLGIYKVIEGVKKLTSANADLSESQTDAQKTTELSNRGIQKLTKNLKKIDTRTSLNGLLAIAEQAGRLSKRGVKDISAFVKEADKIAVSLGDDLGGEIEDNIKLIGKLADNYGVAEKENVDFATSLSKVGSALNEVSANGSASAGYMVDYLKRLVGVSKQTKITAQDQIGYGAVLDESGQSVEVSGTTMSKIMFDMFADTSTYSKIAGVDIKKFTKIMDEDANEAFLLFLEGLNGNNGGLQEMSKKLAELGIKGARSISVLTSLAAETDKVREKQTLANKALKENVSLSEEFQKKNSNLPALLEKISNHFSNLFTAGWIGTGLKDVVGWFGKLVGAIKDVNEQFDAESEATFDSAINNRLLAKESENLLKKYKSLKKDGITPTKDEKIELDSITLQLKDRLGESVIAIDKETGALGLNTIAVKEQIKLKRLSSDEEAMTLVSRAEGAKQESEDIKKTLGGLKDELNARKLKADEERVNFRNSEEYDRKTSRGRLSAIANLPSVNLERDAFLALSHAKGEIVKQDNRRLDLLKKLEELNFTQKDVDSYFATNKEDFTEGTEKMFGTTLMVFKNGKWVAKKTPNGVGGSGDGLTDAKKVALEKKKAEEDLTEFIKKQQEQRLIDGKEGVEKELAQIDAKYKSKIDKATANNLSTKVLEAERDLEKQELILQRQQEFKDKLAEIEENDKLTEEEKAIAKAEAEFEKHTNDLLLLQLNKEEETALLEKLELAENNAIDKIRGKYRKQELKDLNTQKIAKQKINNDIINGAIDLAGRETKVGQALLAIKGFMAAKESLIQLGLLKTKVATTLVGAQADIIKGKTATASVGFPQNIPLLIGFAAQVAGVISAISAVSSSTSGIKAQGYEDGLYDVTRTDGKKFKAPLGTTQTGLVNGPTFMDGNYLAGERSTARNPEMIIDDRTFAKLDPRIPKYIMDVHRGYSTTFPGYQKGKYDTVNDTNQSTPVTSASDTDNVSQERLIDLLEKLEVRLSQPLNARFSYDAVEEITDAQKEIENSSNNGIVS